MTIVEAIGVPAALDQVVEECTELAQAAIKLARVLRGRNPARISEEDAKEHVIEEYADLLLAMDSVIMENLFGDVTSVDKLTKFYDERLIKIFKQKQERWAASIEEEKGVKIDEFFC